MSSAATPLISFTQLWHDGFNLSRLPFHRLSQLLHCVGPITDDPKRYFQQDPEAGRQVQETLKKISASQRATYTRIQAQIRSSYHTSVALRKESEFHAHITSTKPGQSLSPLNRQNPLSESARQERLERLEKLISVWATTGNIGVRPFFDGLYAVLRLQGLPETLGGAGEQRVAWEIDDAVFKESAGKEFMLEAIDVMKGVLGFEETLITGPPDGDLTPSSTTALERPILSEPPPLPARPRMGSKSGDPSLHKGRPMLPTIISASVIQRSDPTDKRSPIERVVVEEDLEDTFADPVPQIPPRKPSIPPRRKPDLNGNHDVENRTRSQSDPFDDTHGHLPYGYGHGRSKTHGSLSGFPTSAPSPSMLPLLVPAGGGGGSSIGTGTTSESVLAKATTDTGSQLKRPVPLPPEDFELEVTGPTTTARLAPTPGLQDSDEEENNGEILGEPEATDRRSSAFGLGFIGKSRRGSETTGLGLLGATKQTTTPEPDRSTAPSRNTITPMPPLPPHDLTPNAKDDGFVLAAHTRYDSIDGTPSPYMRTWLVPSYLTNPELSSLLAVFPPLIARGSVPRFRGAVRDNKKRRAAAAVNDLEAQTDNLTEEREYLRYGTGRIYLGDAVRDEGWKGSMWDRFVGWWRRLFC